MNNHRPNRQEWLDLVVAANREVKQFCELSKATVRSTAEQPDDNHSQFIRHGIAWQATLNAALTAIVDWSQSLHENEKLADLEFAIASLAVRDLLSQISFGIAMSQHEVFRPHHIGLEQQAFQLSQHPTVKPLLGLHSSTQNQMIVSEAHRRQSIGDAGLDESLQQISNQFRTFSRTEIQPFANDWHLQNQLIPDQLIKKLSELGVFGLTIDEKYGGSGLGKLAMCVVTEELSLGYIGTGSLGTRSEIAAELIQLAGTQHQKDKYLPLIADGTILPAAVFTEPETGSDLGAIRTRATRSNNHWQLTGNKTWITHAARSDLMTVLARTDPKQPGYRGLTMFLVDKTRGTDADNFPDHGLTGSEIDVLAYRGMKEYNLAFDEFKIPTDAALGGTDGNGFKQLMTTFEGARIQTAARAVGVAENAFELALSYASQRQQFGQSLLGFERIYGKVALMAADVMTARQLTYRAARIKDKAIRCDIDAGMAKLYAARTAWTCADNAVQIHGGTGYALSSPISRILNDARILSIFEGTAEIQADVIARGLLKD